MPAWSTCGPILPTHLGAVLAPRRTVRGGVRGLRASPRRSRTPSCSTAITKVLTRAIEDAGKDPGRWTDLVSHIASLPVADRDRLLAAFEALDPDTLGDEGRVEVWRALADLAGAASAVPGRPVGYARR